jgi:kynurenine/2-aminoadipate aminotransferase
MFLWVKLLNVENSTKLIEIDARDAKVLLIPGQYFHPDNRISNYVRISYSIESEERCEEGIIRLSNILKNLKN